MFDVITFGSATKDIFLRPKENNIVNGDQFSSGSGVCFSLGSKIRTDEIYFTSGGGGTNAAATFAKQGFSVAYCGKVGRDSAGDAILRELNCYGVDTQLISYSDEKLTNHSVILDTPEVDRTIFVYKGASETQEKRDVFFEDLNAKWFYFAPFSLNTKNLFYDLIDYALREKIDFFINPGKAQLKDEKIKDVLKKAKIVLMNLEETSMLLRASHFDKKKLIKEIAGLRDGITLITLGFEGAVACFDGIFYYSKPIISGAVDRTGAGDSFGSGFLSEFMRSKNIKESIQFAVANSTSCVQEKGAKNGLLKRGENYSKPKVFKSKNIEEII